MHAVPGWWEEVGRGGKRWEEVGRGGKRGEREVDFWKKKKIEKKEQKMSVLSQENKDLSLFLLLLPPP